MSGELGEITENNKLMAKITLSKLVMSIQSLV